MGAGPLHAGAKTLDDLAAGARDDEPATATDSGSGPSWEHACARILASMREAGERDAHHEAWCLFEAGLAASARIDEPPRRQRLECELRLGVFCTALALGRVDEARASLNQVEVIARSLHDDEAVARVSLQAALFCWLLGEFSQGLVYVDCCLRTWGAGRPRQRLAGSLVRLMLMHGLGRYATVSAEAGELARTFVAELDDVRDHTGCDVAPMIKLCVLHADALQRLGDDARALQVCDAAGRWLSRGSSQPAERHALDAVRARIGNAEGNYAETLRLLGPALEGARGRLASEALVYATAAHATALTHVGRADEAIATLRAALGGESVVVRHAYGELFLQQALAEALLARGDCDAALEVAQAALDSVAGAEQYGHQVDGLVGLAEALLGAGRPSQALPYLRQALEQAGRCDMIDAQARIQRRIDDVEDGLRASAAD